MDQRTGESVRARRPVRNKRYTRKPYGEDRRPPKRLFTPEIKRFLKDWLIRRRENPYPNREEKKTLALQTGLTYIQVCNWFANWRRKLKNSGREPQKKTWGDLIKTYNHQVHGNIEHFSISSNDSIWKEPDDYSIQSESLQEQTNFIEHSYTHDAISNNNNNSENQCYFISSTTGNDLVPNPFSQPSNKYKNHIMEKYLRDCQEPEFKPKLEEEMMKPSVITKWLESAVNFRPSESSYLDWTFPKTQRKKTLKPAQQSEEVYQIHGKEELDAAEALTALANAARAMKF